MKKTIRLTESELHGLIRECIEEIMYESRGPLTEAFQSQKLAQLVKQHGGIPNALWLDRDIRNCLHDLSDNDIEGIYKNKDMIMQKGNEYKAIPLKDGTYIAVRPDSEDIGYKIKNRHPKDDSLTTGYSSYLFDKPEALTGGYYRQRGDASFKTTDSSRPGGDELSQALLSKNKGPEYPRYKEKARRNLENYKDIARQRSIYFK